jgi:magnesium chelatase subunit I
VRDIEAVGTDAICPDCARKYAEGSGSPDRVRLVELPLNAKLEDVVGGIDERATVHERMRLKRGLLAQADRNLLYVDEVNLLASEIVDALLDAAAQGIYTVRRGPLAATFRSRFVLIGSMNPEEGRLRPQIMDRFGLRVVVQGLEDTGQRLEAYQRVQAYQSHPRQVSAAYADETGQARQEIQFARSLLPQVVLSEEAARLGLEWIHRLQIDSLRAEITLFEAARAYAAADGRKTAEPADLAQVAPCALRLRRSKFMVEYFASQRGEEDEILELLGEIRPS